MYGIADGLAVGEHVEGRPALPVTGLAGDLAGAGGMETEAGADEAEPEAGALVRRLPQLLAGGAGAVAALLDTGLQVEAAVDGGRLHPLAVARHGAARVVRVTAGGGTTSVKYVAGPSLSIMTKPSESVLHPGQLPGGGSSG